jgi:hypothetical protein
MRIFRVCWSLLLLAILAHPAFPGIRASFSLDYSAWGATHIVLVVTTPNDDTFEVVESWKGDLRVGERRSTGPSLSQGWWNENPTPHAPLRERYGQTYQLILGLQQIHYPEALNTAMQLRDFWRSLPQLNDPNGLNQIAEACDKLIAQLQGK